MHYYYVIVNFFKAREHTRWVRDYISVALDTLQHNNTYTTFFLSICKAGLQRSTHAEPDVPHCHKQGKDQEQEEPIPQQLLGIIPVTVGNQTEGEQYC